MYFYGRVFVVSVLRDTESDLIFADLICGMYGARGSHIRYSKDGDCVCVCLSVLLQSAVLYIGVYILRLWCTTRDLSIFGGGILFFIFLLCFSFFLFCYFVAVVLDYLYYIWLVRVQGTIVCARRRVYVCFSIFFFIRFVIVSSCAGGKIIKTDSIRMCLCTIDATHVGDVNRRTLCVVHNWCMQMHVCLVNGIQFDYAFHP